MWLRLGESDASTMDFELIENNREVQEKWGVFPGFSNSDSNSHFKGAAVPQGRALLLSLVSSGWQICSAVILAAWSFSFLLIFWSWSFNRSCDFGATQSPSSKSHFYRNQLVIHCLLLAIAFYICRFTTLNWEEPRFFFRYRLSHQGSLLWLNATIEDPRTSLVAQTVENLPAVLETWVQSLGWEDPLEKEMETHSSILAWRIPRTEEPGGLQSMKSQRVGHDWMTDTFTFTSKHLYLEKQQYPLCS